MPRATNNYGKTHWSSTSLRIVCTLLLGFLLNSCGTTTRSTSSSPFPSTASDRDGPPEIARDISAIPEPVPRSEPLSRYGNPASYEVFGKTYHTMKSSAGYVERGTASWYGTKFHGRRTSSGEPYDLYGFTAAHKALPLPTYVRVTNLSNNRSLIVRVNDRGPFHEDRLIDLSYAAASKLGILATGTGQVEVRAIDTGAAPPTLAADASPFAQPYGNHPGPAVQTNAQTRPVYLQAGSFLSRSNAEDMRAQLASSVSTSIEIIQAYVNNSPVYRVRLGPLQDLAEADRLTNALTRLGFGVPRLVND
jgi:rare lipoprotein A